MASATKEKPNNNKMTEEESVVVHRRAFFFEILGWDYDKEIIESLVFSKVDPHDARKLKNAGCPPDLIHKILL